MDFAPFSGTENGDAEAPLTGSFERCYVRELALLAGVAKLAYAADSKSAGLRPVGVQVPPPAFITLKFEHSQLLFPHFLNRRFVRDNGQTRRRGLRMAFFWSTSRIRGAS